MSLPQFNKNYNEDSISRTAKADHDPTLKILIDTVWDFTSAFCNELDMFSFPPFLSVAKTAACQFRLSIQNSQIFFL